ncbi:MAG: Gldg family protein [Clostridia bacterium]|nr:Gldg family protein [Clostridia bacterium]
MKTSTGRKIRYGGTSIAITALIIAVVIILNAIMTLLTKRFMWYGDMTPKRHFTITEKCLDLIGEEDPNNDANSPVEMVKKFREENKAYNAEKGLNKGDEGYRDENVMINILFPVEPDVLQADPTSLYVYQSAEELRSKFPEYISVECVNSINNPKRFQKYLDSNTEVIANNSVVIECGSEYIVRIIRNFYAVNNDEPFAYNGEKTFAAAMLAVTRAEMPLACYTTNHGEQFPVATGDSENVTYPFITTLENAGYRVQALDLASEEIPEACRLLITFNPKKDFISGNTGLEQSGELKKLDDFLANQNSYMVFLEHTTGELENLEEFLAEWGLKVARNDGSPVMIKDTQNSINSSSAVIAKYEENDLMAGLAKGLSGKVIFENAMEIEYANGYTPATQALRGDDTGTKFFEMAGSYAHDTAVFPNFTSNSTAVSTVNGAELGKYVSTDPFKLMATAVKTTYEQELYTVIEDSAYVTLCGSVDFASEEYLYSNSFDNEDFLLSAFRKFGGEPVPTGLDYIEFANYEIEQISTGEATKYTVALTVAPLTIALIAGVFVLVRRKNR